MLDGRPVSDEEMVGLLIALLMAGQHTSSTTSTWMGFFLAQDPALQQRLYEEQLAVLGTKRDHSLTLEEVGRMYHLHSTLRETLRLRPPIMTLMRKCVKPLTISVNGKSYTIPAGNQVCDMTTATVILCGACVLGGGSFVVTLKLKEPIVNIRGINCNSMYISSFVTLWFLSIPLLYCVITCLDLLAFHPLTY